MRCNENTPVYRFGFRNKKNGHYGIPDEVATLDFITKHPDIYFFIEEGFFRLIDSNLLNSEGKGCAKESRCFCTLSAN